MRQNRLNKVAFGIILTVFLALTHFSILETLAQEPTANEQLRKDVVSSGGRKGVSTSYKHTGTITQTSVGRGVSETWQLGAGFWQGFTAGEVYVCGDVNGDGEVNLSDIVYFINYMFQGGDPPQCPIPYTPCADAGGDGEVGLADVVYLINYVLKSGPPPIC